ncbi:MAG: ATP-dependent Clp protease ATP-binding subunit ClpC, partial [Clostridia bacterium]|nr:ATP-dependent Clp protease ATP-binding subunit ClpC [Clostridia bacterium]
MFRFNGFTEKANKAINLAIESAENFGHTYIGSEHLLLGILYESSGTAYALLNAQNISSDTISKIIEEKIGRGSKTSLTPDALTPRAKRILEMSIAAARGLSSGYVGTEHILLGLIQEAQSCAVRFLEECGADLEEISDQIISTSTGNTVSQGMGATPNKDKSNKGGNGGLKTLSQFGRDLTADAEKDKIDPVIGREEEIERVIQILVRRTKNNP